MQQVLQRVICVNVCVLEPALGCTLTIILLNYLNTFTHKYLILNQAKATKIGYLILLCLLPHKIRAHKLIIFQREAIGPLLSEKLYSEMDTF